MLFTATKGNDAYEIEADNIYEVLMACRNAELSEYDITLQEDT